ncbi:MAG: hypothetical protein AB8G86_17825 [Saprospiraceae bacterium]
MRFTITMLFVLSSLGLFAQLSDPSQNTADRLLGGSNNLNIAGYADIDFNQPLGGGQRNNGKLDIHRLVMLFGYKFDKRTSFVTEIEFEHVKELAVEQAFVNYRVNQYFNFRGGLLLIPMGIVNEYHEGPSRHGVERPNVDKFIVPTTWRELGFGFTGRIDELAMKYQVYVVNGFNGFDGAGKFTGKNGLRSGRQKGAESFSSSPNLSTKLDFYGISGLKLGVAGYFGDSQSTLYDGVDKNDAAGLARADSSTVGVAMIGIDARYNIKGWELRGQLNYTSLSNTMAYNAFTGNDVGSKMSGYYLEAAYNVFQKNQEVKTELFPFFRYEQYNTHQSVTRTIEQNNAFKRTELTAGLTWKMNPGTALKLDYQWLKTDADNGFKNQLNIGLGVWFY